MRNGWRPCPLSEAIDITIGRQRSPKHQTGEHVVPYLRAANVKDARLLLNDVLTMNFTPIEQETFALRNGDVLVTEGCGSIGELGASAMWRADLPGTVCFQNTLLRLRARPGVTIPGFVEQWSRWAHRAGVWATIASGTNIFHIGLNRAKRAEIDLPPIAEQRRIVDLLVAVDDALAATRKTGTAAQAALMSHLNQRLVNWQGTSDTATLGELVEMGSGPSWKSADESPTPVADSVRVIGITNTPASGELDMTNEVYVAGLSGRARLLDPHSLILIRTNGNRERIGNVYKVTPDAVGAAYSAFQIGLFPHEPGDSPFVYWFLKAPSVQRSMTDAASGTTGLGNIAIRWLRDLDVPWPQPDERDSFVATAESIANVEREASRQMDAMTRLRSALLSDLLSGAHEIPESYDALLESAS
jgi:hypothetical protein